MHKTIQSDFKNPMSYRPKSKRAKGQHLATRIKTTGMATHGSVSAFEQSKEDWTSYVERLDFYFTANDVTIDVKKRAILLSACGASTYKLICMSHRSNETELHIIQGPNSESEAAL